MGAMASQITSLTIVYSNVNSGADQRKHQSSASLALCGDFPAQRASSAENVPIWWRHHAFNILLEVVAVWCQLISIMILSIVDNMMKWSITDIKWNLTKKKKNRSPILQTRHCNICVTCSAGYALPLIKSIYSLIAFSSLFQTPQLFIQLSNCQGYIFLLCCRAVYYSPFEGERHGLILNSGGSMNVTLFIV